MPLSPKRQRQADGASEVHVVHHAQGDGQVDVFAVAQLVYVDLVQIGVIGQLGVAVHFQLHLVALMVAVQLVDQRVLGIQDRAVHFHHDVAHLHAAVVSGRTGFHGADERAGGQAEAGAVGQGGDGDAQAGLAEQGRINALFGAAVALLAAGIGALAAVAVVILEHFGDQGLRHIDRDAQADVVRLLAGGEDEAAAAAGPGC